jgi:hypothetical protein
MNRPRGPRASYLVASVRTLAEQLDALSLLLREENSAR